MIGIILTLIMTFSSFTVSFADTIDATDQGVLDRYALDSHEDDPVSGKLDKDDFATPAEWEAYLAKNPEESISVLANSASPSKTVSATATLKYTVKDLPVNRVIQKFYVGTKFLYVVQRKGVDAYLSRCTYDADKKVATRKDYMILRNFGHTQTLEWFDHNGKEYFWIGCKANTAETYADYNWAMQIGRIEYQYNEDPSVPVEISDFTEICRFSNLHYANETATRFGSVKRVEAALTTDRSKLLFWVQNTDNDIQMSYYNTETLNTLLDGREGKTNKFVSCIDNANMISACLGSFTQSTNKVLPNGSCQGIEFNDSCSIFIGGGNTGETPKIAKMNGSGSDYEYSCLLTANNSAFDSNTEMEGLQLRGDNVYFGIADHTIDRDQEQYIYYVLKSAF